MSEEINDLVAELRARWTLLCEDYQKLLVRYDDAMKRINDMQAELEYLRREVRRG